MIKDIRFALLVTKDGDYMHGRPMAAIQDEFKGELWFFTSIRSPKVREIEKEPYVLLNYAEPKHQQYVSLQGKAEIVVDRQKIKDLWSEPVRIWFPKGPEDPEIALLRVTPDAAEYWDSSSATLMQLFGYAKARLTGEKPAPGEMGENKKVAFS
jgi:general stress protein 26